MKKIILFFLVTVMTNISYADCFESYIKDKTNEGSVIIIPEGTYVVDVEDRADTSMWHSGDNVAICDESEMINTDEKEKVGVRKIN